MAGKWKSSIILIGLFVAFSGQALAVSASDIQKKYSSYKDFETTFSQKSYQVLLKREVNFQGTIIFKKPGGVRMDVFKPQRQVLILKGEKLYVILPEEKKVAVQEIPKEIATQNFLSFMAGLTTLDKDYKIKQEKDRLILNPKNGNGEIIVWADENSIITRIKVTDSMGNRSDITLGKYRYNISPSDTLFNTPDEGETQKPEPKK